MTRRIFPILCMAVLCAVIPLTVSAQETTHQGPSSLANAEKNRYGLCSVGPSFKSPIFDNVGRVVIFIDGPTYLFTPETQESLPDPLRLENLKATLKDIYTARYEKYKKNNDANYKGCYNRNNQEVEVATGRKFEDREKYREIAKNPDVLFVLVKIGVTSVSRFGAKPVEPSIAMSVLHYRADLNIPIIDQVHLPKVFPLQIADEYARKHLIDYIANSIL